MSTELKQAAQAALDAWQTSSYGTPSHQKAMLLAMANLHGELARTHQPEAGPVSAEARFAGMGWQSCSVEHARMVLATPSEWPDYEVRLLYAQQPAQVVPEVLGTVLAYTRGGAPGVYGQTCGADGAGDYAFLFYGDVTSCDDAARAHIRSLEARGIRVTNCVLVRNEATYSGPAITMLAASQHGGSAE